MDPSTFRFTEVSARAGTGTGLGTVRTEGGMLTIGTMEKSSRMMDSTLDINDLDSVVRGLGSI